MKSKLRERYIPSSYQQNLLGHLERLTQGNRSVSNYIDRFEHLMHYIVNMDPYDILIQFEEGLRKDIQR